MTTGNPVVSALLNFAFYVNLASSSFTVVDDKPGNSSKSQWMDQLVHNIPIALGDGGYVDNSGIAQSISAGAEIVVALNGGIWDLFTDSPASLQSRAFAAPRTIFAETYEQALLQQQQNMRFLNLSGSETILTGIGYSTIEATTVDAESFGIKAGKRITLHVVIFSPKQSPFKIDFDNYSQFSAEILAVIKHPTNTQGVKDLRQRFSGNFSESIPDFTCCNKQGWLSCGSGIYKRPVNLVHPWTNISHCCPENATLPLPCR